MSNLTNEAILYPKLQYSCWFLWLCNLSPSFTIDSLVIRNVSVLCHFRICLINNKGWSNLKKAKVIFMPLRVLLWISLKNKKSITVQIDHVPHLLGFAGKGVNRNWSLHGLPRPNALIYPRNQQHWNRGWLLAYYQNTFLWNIWHLFLDLMFSIYLLIAETVGYTHANLWSFSSSALTTE